MKIKKSFKEIICLLVVTTMIATPFFAVPIKKAEAESLSGYIGNLAPVIAKMPGCKKAIGSGISDLFSSVKKLFNGKSKTGSSTSSKTIDDVIAKLGVDAVQTYDPETIKKLNTIEGQTSGTQKAVENQDKNENCLNSIGKAVAKVLINELTKSIINWIQTGDDGGPLFVQDPGAFFQNIAETETLQFIGEINNPELYPFAEEFINNQRNLFTTKFANNAQYSLNTVIQNSNPNFSAAGFQGDFSQGGWMAWDSMIQNAANNPLGFSLMASNELAARIESKTNLAQSSLQQSGGFLGIQKCIKPKNVSKVEHEAGLLERANKPAGSSYDNQICTDGWETVTPGKLIGDELVSTVQKKDNALLDVETLNDAVAAILDAVLSKFTNTLQGDDGLMGVEIDNVYASNDSNVNLGGGSQNDFSDSQINASTWLQQHPDFDITKDLNQALIDEQRIYQDKLKEQNRQIQSTVPVTSEAPLGNYGLIPTIYQLDYCIPGPHPGWEEETQRKLGEVQGKMSSTNFRGIADTTGYELLGTFTGGIGTAIIDFVNGAAMACGDDKGGAARESYLAQFDILTHAGDGGLGDPNWNGGIDTDKNANSKFCVVEGFIGATDKAQEEYEKGIKEFYQIKYLPSAARESKTYFGKIDDYNQIMRDNDKTIDALIGIITRLTEIKSRIDTLNLQLANNQITDDQYEGRIEGFEGITPWKNAFARISSSFYSGDDIADADNVTRQIVDEMDYITKNLIKSDTGCEKEVANLSIPFYNIEISSTVRRDYPMPHLYNYPERLVDWKNPNPVKDKDKTFTPITYFYNSWGANKKGKTASCPTWALKCFDLANFVDLNDPFIGGGGYYWEKAFGIW